MFGQRFLSLALIVLSIIESSSPLVVPLAPLSLNLLNTSIPSLPPPNTTSLQFGPWPPLPFRTEFLYGAEWSVTVLAYGDLADPNDRADLLVDIRGIKRKIGEGGREGETL